MCSIHSKLFDKLLDIYYYLAHYGVILQNMNIELLTAPAAASFSKDRKYFKHC